MYSKLNLIKYYSYDVTFSLLIGFCSCVKYILHVGNESFLMNN